MDYAGAELEADFHERWRIDILDFFRGRYPWGKFLRMVEQLPTASHYRNKVLKDRDIAAALAALDDGEDEAMVVDLPFTEETTTVSLLRTTTDLLRQLIYLTAANSKAHPPEPGPRPRTALSVIKEEQAFATLDDALMMLTGSTWDGIE